MKNKKNYRLDTYEGIRESVKGWLESGKLTRLSPLLPKSKRAKLIKSVYEFKNVIETYETEKSGFHISYNPNKEQEKQKQIITKFNKTFKEFMGDLMDKTEMFERAPNGAFVSIVESNKPLTASTNISGDVSGMRSKYTTDDGKPINVDNLGGLSDNWDYINTQIGEYDIIANNFLGYYGVYLDWEERFLKEVGMDWALDSLGNNHELFNLLLSFQVNKATIPELNAYLNENGIIFNLKDGDAGLSRIWDQIADKADKSERDYNALEIIENIRKYI